MEIKRGIDIAVKKAVESINAIKKTVDAKEIAPSEPGKRAGPFAGPRRRG
jgi:chaperonin GroEL (HSP60 family)